MSTSIVRLHRVLRADPKKVYRAFLDPDAMVKWLPPHGFTGKIHHVDATAGGTYKMSFTNFTTGHSHSFAGTFLELVPHERIRHTDTFDDPGLPGAMQTTVSLKRVSCGTEVNIVQDKKGYLRPSRQRRAISAGRNRSLFSRSSSKLRSRGSGTLPNSRNTGTARR
jgi:uncharacterized protein YndB with AHSA1/START domain